jgi:hypothetical protein
MTKKEAVAKITTTVEYLLQHCDSEDETNIVEWAAAHLAREFEVDGLLFSDTTFIQAA